MPSSSSQASLTDVAVRATETPPDTVITNSFGDDAASVSTSEKDSVFVGSTSIDDRPRHDNIMLSKEEYQEHHSAIMQGRYEDSYRTNKPMFMSFFKEKIRCAI